MISCVVRAIGPDMRECERARRRRAAAAPLRVDAADESTRLSSTTSRDPRLDHPQTCTNAGHLDALGSRAGPGGARARPGSSPPRHHHRRRRQSRLCSRRNALGKYAPRLAKPSLWRRRIERAASSLEVSERRAIEWRMMSEVLMQRLEKMHHHHRNHILFALIPIPPLLRQHHQLPRGEDFDHRHLFFKEKRKRK